MKRLTKPLTGLLALAMMLTVASAAFAFTHYPNATCPDTLSIQQLKTRLDGPVGPGLCNPQDQASVPSSAPGDSVFGVGGIIIGFDPIPTGFDFFIQTSGGGPNTGLDVFTHGQPFGSGYALGDSIIVEYAGVADFQGDKELEAPNNNFAAPDIILRKVNSGNTLPPFFVGNTTDLKELPTNATFAPYVSALVHLNGPVRVARISTNSGGLGLSAPSFGMLVVSDAAPSDSVFIDLQKCVTIFPPPVGSIFNSIQGIGNKATRGFRIMPRSTDDIDDNCVTCTKLPPGVTDAYATADNKYRVQFDRSVTAGTATNTGNYTLGSFGSVDAAVMDGTTAAILTVSGTGLSHGGLETVNVAGITGVANGQTMTTPQATSFLFGALSCGEMSQPEPDTLAANPCVDEPLYAGPGGEFSSFGIIGTRSTATGIITQKSGNIYYMEDGVTDPAVSQHNTRGLTVFAPPNLLSVGHRYVIAGAAQNFWGEAEFTAISFIQDLGAATAPPWLSLTPDIMVLGDPCDASQTQLTPRDYLSTLVRMTGLKVVAKQLTPGTPGQRLLTGNNGFWVAGPAPTYPDTFIVENLNTSLGLNQASNPNYPALNTPLNLTGVLHFINNPANPNSAANARTFRICPQSAAGITANVGVGDDPTPAALSFSVYPNPARTVNLSFSLRKTTEVDLAVYDLLGRKVAQIAKGTYPAGTHQKVWNATNSAGAHVGPGVYFYRLRAGDEVRSTRTLLLGN
jgi:hypothetical protein